MELLSNGPNDAPLTILFAHGAGLGMDAPFMAVFAKGLADAGHRVVRFEFPYMAQRRATGSRRLPDRQPVLLDAFHEAIELAKTRSDGLVLAGKSMGGRMASMIADDVGAAALVVYGYPFHPPGKPETLRTDHLGDLKIPTLVCQGERDPFGTKGEVEAFGLSNTIEFCWLNDGDHNFKPRKASGTTEQENWVAAIEASVRFIAGLKVR